MKKSKLGTSQRDMEGSEGEGEVEADGEPDQDWLPGPMSANPTWSVMHSLSPKS